jgi:hypothetical protein
MALFGAPVSHPDDARARRAGGPRHARRPARLQRRARGAGAPAPSSIGIGINTGEVVAGYIGSSKAMQYTVIGAPVNLAARLCSAAKSMQILMSETTLSLVSSDHFEVRELEPIKPKGIAQPVRVFEVLRENPSAARRRPRAERRCTEHDAPPSTRPPGARAPHRRPARRGRGGGHPRRRRASPRRSTRLEARDPAAPARPLRASSAPGTRCSSRVTPSGPTPSTTSRAWSRASSRCTATGACTATTRPIVGGHRATSGAARWCSSGTRRAAA